MAIMPFDRRQLDSDLSDTLTDTFQFEFGKAVGRQVLGSGDLANLIGFERQKELLGCDATSCLAEIGGMLGVRYVMFGRFARVGQTFVLSVKLMDVSPPRLVAQDQEHIPLRGNAKDEREQALLEGVQRLANRFGTTVKASLFGGKTAANAPAQPAPDNALTPPAENGDAQPANPTAEATPTTGPTRTTGGLGNTPWIGSAVANGLCLGFGCFSCCAGTGLAGLLAAITIRAYGLGGLVPLVACWPAAALSFVVAGVGTPTTAVLYFLRNAGAREEPINATAQELDDAPEDAANNDTDGPAPAGGDKADEDASPEDSNADVKPVGEEAKTPATGEDEPAAAQEPDKPKDPASVWDMPDEKDKANAEDEKESKHKKSGKKRRKR